MAEQPVNTPAVTDSEIFQYMDRVVAPLAPLTEMYGRGMKLYNLPAPEDVAKLALFAPTLLPVYEKGSPDGRQVWFVPSTVFDSNERGPRRKHRVMIIGKVLGKDEEARCANFIGPSGDLIKSVASEIKLNMSDFYVGNVVRFLPPDGGKTLHRLHIADCMPLLLRDILMVEPEWLLLMGADAVRAVFGKASLEAVRSSVFYFENGVHQLGSGKLPPRLDDEAALVKPAKGFKVFATTHPVRVLRESGFLEGFRADMIKFQRLLCGGASPVVAKPVDYQFTANLDGVKRYVDMYRPVAGPFEVAVDCEWGGDPQGDGELRTVQLCMRERTAVVLSLCEPGGIRLHKEKERGEIFEYLRVLLTDPLCRIIGHNFRADAKWLASRGLDVVEHLSFDTMLADHVLNENSEHGLEACAVRYTDMGRYDYNLAQWIKANGNKKERGYLDVPDDILLPYAAKDADCTLRVKSALALQLDDPNNAPLKRLFHEIVMPCNLPIHEIEMSGILADRNRMVGMTDAYAAKREEIQNDIRLKLGMPEFNARSTQQLQKLLFGPPVNGGLGLSPLKTTGKPAKMWDEIPVNERSRHSASVDMESVEALASAHPIADRIRDFKIVDQVIKNFLCPKTEAGDQEDDYEKGLISCIAPDGRIRTTISQMSETGRHKSSRPNCFVAGTEYLIKRGWMLLDETNDSDEFAQMDTEDRLITFEKPLAKTWFRYKGDIVTLRSRYVDLAMTTDHVCLYWDGRGFPGAYCRRMAIESPHSLKAVHAGRRPEGEYLNDLQSVLVAMMVLHGGIMESGRMPIADLTPARAAWVLEGLKHYGFEHDGYYSEGRRHAVWITVPKPLRQMTSLGPWIFFLAGESCGNLAKAFERWQAQTGKLTFPSPSQLDWFQALMAMSGYRTAPCGELQLPSTARAGGGYVSSLRHAKHKIEKYDGWVGCVRMPKGTVVVRHKGKVCITGQCQNLPKRRDEDQVRIMGAGTPKLRSCFTIPDGNVLIEADYKSAEIFTLGRLSRCQKLVSDARTDIHARGAVTRFGAPKWDGFDANKLPPKEWKEDTHNKTLRICSKTVVFGIPYQRGAAAIAREIVKATKGQVACTKEKAQGFIDGFYDDYQETREYVELCYRSVLVPGYITNAQGRRRRFYASGATERSVLAAFQREATNFPIQSSVADTLNNALINLYHWRRLNPGEATYKILLAVHDAILIETPGECARVVIERVLPECMSRGAVIPSWKPVVPHMKPDPEGNEVEDLLGHIKEWVTEPFTLDIDVELGTRWGEPATPEDLKARGVPDDIIEKYV